MTDLKIFNDQYYSNTRTDRSLQIPIINPASIPPNASPGQIGYSSDALYISNGQSWFPVGGGGMTQAANVGTGTGLIYRDKTGNILNFKTLKEGNGISITNNADDITLTSTANGTTSFSFIKSGSQVISPSTPTTLTSWTVAGSNSYHTLPQWNLATGIYTASATETISISPSISWASGISNLGTRILRVVYFNSGTLTTTIVKEDQTQADPSISIPTTQFFTINLLMNANDQVYVQVEHDAPVNLSIMSGYDTTISGLRII
jgi:hypothetical protein